MNEETDSQQPNPVAQSRPLVPVQPTINNQDSGIAPPLRSSGEKVIQPSETIKQELQAQQQTVQPSVIARQNPQPIPTQAPTSNTPSPNPDGHLQVGMSASQMGLAEPKHKLFDFNPKQLLVKGLIALVILGVIFAALVATNIVALSEFKTISYVNDKGTRFKIDFYTKHGSKQLKSGNTQLVSKVSKDNKFPVAMSISNATESGYSRTKDCSGFTKVFDVQNNSLNQKIAVCDFGKKAIGQSAAAAVYVAGFTYKDQAHIITIGQDYGSIDLSSQSGAQESLTRFGMEPYKEDIDRIVSSIKVE